MGSIIHQKQNLDVEDNVAPDSAAHGQPLNAFLADRKRQGGCGPRIWVANKRPDMSRFPMKCGACGDPNHVWSTCKAPDADVLRWTLAKRKHIAGMYVGQSPPTAHLNDVAAAIAPLEDGAVCPLEYEIKDEYDDTVVSVSFTYVAFTSHASSVADMSDYWVVDCASSVHQTEF
jgi:hypothetical protein